MRVETNFGVAYAGGKFCRSLELFDRKVALTHPGADNSKIVKGVGGIE